MAMTEELHDKNGSSKTDTVGWGGETQPALLIKKPMYSLVNKWLK